MELAALSALLDRAADLTVAVVGDLMLDRYVYGEVSRISPEAPIPVLRGRSEAVMLGAAGNVARNLTALGARVRLAGRIGDDEAGEAVLSLLSEEPAITPSLDRREGARTTCKTRFVAAGQQLLRLDHEDELAGGAGDVSAELRSALAGAAVVLVSDYAKGFVTAAVLDAAHAAGVPVIVDPKGRDFARYGPVALLKPNASELAAAVGLPVGSDDETERALAAALQRFPARAVLVTRGAQGMSLAERGGGPVRHFRAHRREVFDVSGAGDTGLAALGLALAAGAGLGDAAAFAVAASGVAVGKPGTAVVSAAEVREAEAAAVASHGGKVSELGAATAQARRWRAEGLRVGFTNGCFDVLHAGHVAYLAQARAWCDRLVVGVNSDASVRGLKGEGRPVNDLDNRAAVLAALAAVDLVVAFDAPTPRELISAIRPDVLVKGADYTEAQVVGADLVRGWGGEVRLAPLLEGRSTTATLAKLKAAG